MNLLHPFKKKNEFNFYALLLKKLYYQLTENYNKYNV